MAMADHVTDDVVTGGHGIEPRTLPTLETPLTHDACAPVCPAHPHLSAVELAVLRDAAEGMTMVESASHRVKSIETVKTQRKSLLLKLGARNMTHAVAIASSSGLIEIAPRPR